MSQTRSDLTGATALITGAAKRLGAAIALGLADKGANVVVHYNSSADAAEDLAEQIRSLGRKAWTVQADLTSTEQAEGLVDRCCQAAGDVHVLINNASIFPADRITTAGVDEILENIHLHALSPLLLTRGFARRGALRHVVNMLDARIVDYDRFHAAYHLSKRMLMTLTRMLALELAPAVAVNAVAPGPVLPAAGQSQQQFEAVVESIPLRRVGALADVTEAVLFLLNSRFITGQVVFVDGGRHMKANVYG
ncbi:MAG: SDR family oxidoreductase [Planctomycetes bacterium]|nr:SDR family oxidoreductase [Planctomycetota bacterium]